MKNVCLSVIGLCLLGIILMGCPSPAVPEVKYTVTFDANNGEDVVTQTVVANGTVEKPANPVKDGWKFLGWYSNTDVKFYFDTPITADRTLTAKWEGTVYFYDGQKEEPTEKNFEEGKTVSSPSVADFEKDGVKYSFLYWSENKDATEDTREVDEFDFSKELTSSPINLYAVYSTKNIYTVTFDFNGLDKEPVVQKIIEGETTKSLSYFYRSGYDFMYWYIEDENNPDDYKTEFDLNNEVTCDLTLKAKWTVGVYSCFLYNGVVRMYNYAEDDITDEEFFGLNLTYQIDSDTTSYDLPVTSRVVNEDNIFFYFDFVNPQKKLKYTVTVSNAEDSYTSSKDFYPLVTVSNLKAVTDETSVTLSWDKVEGYSNYTVKYYPTNDSSKVTEKKDLYLSATISGLTIGTEYTFEVYTQSDYESNPYRYDVPIIFSEKESITATPKIEKKSSDYLMIMYMDGDNNLNDPIFLDMNEVEYGLYQIRNSDNSAKNGYASVNVVALWDGWAGDSTGTPQIGKKETYIYEIGTDSGIGTTYVDSLGCVLSSNTKDLTKKASWITDGEVNMGDKQTLVNFLNWVNERYEAENVILQFSNHGGGPRSAPIYAKTEDGLTVKLDNYGRRAMCWDDNSFSPISGEAFLKTKDVSDALAEVGYGTSNQLDMILMDVCLGASIEDAYQFKDFAKYMVASPNTVGGMGMDYVAMMESFTSDSTIESIGKQLIDDFKYYYRLSSTEWSSLADPYEVDVTQVMLNSMVGIATLSMIDLSQIDAVEDSISALAQLLVNNKDKVVEGKYYDEKGNIVNEESVTTTPVPYLDLLKDYIRMSGMTGNSLYYAGTYSWLFDIGYIIDNFALVSGATNNGSANPFAWSELATACENVKTSLESAMVKAWRDAPSWKNLYEDYLGGGTHYGLTISGETIAIEGESLTDGTCPDFYKTDLAFGADSAWADLLVEWFGE